MVNNHLSFYFLLIFFIFAHSLALVGRGRSYAQESQYLKMGIADYEDESYEEALDNLLKAYNEGHSPATAAYYIGLTYKNILNYGEARNYLEKALSLDPSLGEAHLYLGEVLYGLNLYPEAGAALAMAREQGIRPAYTAYLTGLLFLKTGENDRAVEELKEAISIDRAFNQKATYSIGRAYLNKGGMEREAKEAFEEAIALDPESDTATYARRSLDAIASKSKVKPFKFTVGYSFQYDDNVILKPSEEISGVEITDEEDSRSVFTFKSEYNSGTREPVGLKAHYSFYQSLHQDLDTFDVQGHKVVLSPSLNTKKGEINLSGSFDYIFLDRDRYLQMINLSPSYIFSIGDKQRGVLSLEFMQKEFLQSTFDIDEDRDATNIAAGFNYFIFYKDNKGYLSLGYRFDKEDTDGNNWEYLGNRGTISVSYPVTKALRLNITGDYYHQDYRNIHTTYGEKREDRTYTFASTLTYSLKKIAFKLQYLYMRDDSNIAVYDYGRNIYGIGIEYSL